MALNAGALLGTDPMKVRRGLSSQYGIPDELFVPAIDPILKAVDDHVIFPISEYWSHNRWVRVSNYDALMKACFDSEEILEGKTLIVFVMPYISLKDAHLIHSLIQNKGNIAFPNKESGGFHVPVPGRYGVLSLNNQDNPSPPVKVRFYVINYGLLRSKAQQHDRLASVIRDTKDLCNQLNFQFSKLLDGSLGRVAAPQQIQKFEDTARIAQESLVLSLYKHQLYPHDFIADFDTDIHDQIYDNDSDPCVNPDAPSYDEMPQETRIRLEEYVQQLSISGHEISSPKKAELEVLAAEGRYDAENVFARASESLKKALENCRGELGAAIHDLTSADVRHSLIGVQGKAGRVALNSPQV